MVSLSVAGKLTFLDLWRAYMHAGYFRILPVSVLAFAAWRVFITGLAQVGNHLLPQFAHRLSVDAFVNVFV